MRFISQWAVPSWRRGLSGFRRPCFWAVRSGKLEVVGNIVFIFVIELGERPLSQFAKDFPKTDDGIGVKKWGVRIFREAFWNGDSASGGPVGEVANRGGAVWVESLCLGLERGA